MTALLGSEYEAWEQSLEQPLYQGVRISPMKQDVQLSKAHLDFLQSASPFAQKAWYCSGHHGLHPAHLQGLIYFQEPSAGSAVTVLDPRPGEMVLDLCAAPGSKSTQILAGLEDGFLVSNEIDAKRAKILLSNMERMGAENFMVTSMDSGLLCRQMPEMFDKILVDAPCSGEGMMKKHDAARDEWSLENVLLCAARQKDILKNAWKALKPGGTLVYSTCTYAPEENEKNTAWMLEQFEDAILEPVDVSWGRPGILLSGSALEGKSEKLADLHLKVRRIFPMDGGEGHYVCKFKKQMPDASLQEEQEAPVKEERISKKALKKQNAKAGKKGTGEQKPDGPAKDFLSSMLPQGYQYYRTIASKDGTKLYGMNHPFIALDQGTVLRQGVLIGETIKKRFEPAHAFFLSASYARNGENRIETSWQGMDKFVHGEQLGLQDLAGYEAGTSALKKGWQGLTYRGIPYGFGKSDGSRVTNKYPKGLRLNPGSHTERDTMDHPNGELEAVQ